MQFTEFMFRTFYELQISFVKKYTFCKHMIYLTKAFFFCYACIVKEKHDQTFNRCREGRTEYDHKL